MAISNRLKEIYSNHYEQTQFYEAVELSHPNFNFGAELYPRDDLYPNDILYPNTVMYGTSVFLIQNTEPMEFNIDGNKITFSPYPFAIVTPNVGDDNQDIQVVFDNISRDIIEGIELAAQNTDIPIKMRYFVFVEGETGSQITPITLSLTNVTATTRVVSATASRISLYDYYFPSTGYFDIRFKGLQL